MILVLQLVIIIVMITKTTGRIVMSSYGEHSSPSSYVYHHWYDPTVESEDDNDDTDTYNVAEDDILSSVLDIFNSDRMQNMKKDSKEDDLLSSIYEDIMDPVIKESIKRKKHSTIIRDLEQEEGEKYVNYGEEILTATQKIKEKEGLGPTNNIFSNILSPKTQKKVGEGISIIHSAIPNYQILLLYVVYVIGGTLVMSLPALL